MTQEELRKVPVGTRVRFESPTSARPEKLREGVYLGLHAGSIDARGRIRPEGTQRTIVMAAKLIHHHTTKKG